MDKDIAMILGKITELEDDIESLSREVKQLGQIVRTHDQSLSDMAVDIRKLQGKR